MGLDLILYKGENYDVDRPINELAYGRKTWAIASFLKKRSEAIDGDWEYLVPESAWNEFIVVLDRLNDLAFRTIVENFLAEERRYDAMTYEEFNGVDDKEKEAFYSTYEILESWLDSALQNSGGYTLGFTWELYAVLRWFDADEKVRQAYEDKFPVHLIVSY